MWSVLFKGDISIPTDRWGRATYEARKKSAAIKVYVESGEFEENIFKEDLKKYVENELMKKFQMMILSMFYIISIIIIRKDGVRISWKK